MSFELGTGGGQVGDILPTVVTAAAAKQYIGETDTEWKRLDADVRNSTATTDETFRHAFGTDFAAWLTFRDDAIANVGFFDAKATMDQTDRWHQKAADWRTALQQKGATVTGPAPVAPGQGIATGPSSSAITWLVGAALIVGGVFAVGYLLRSVPHVPSLPKRREAIDDGE